MITPLLTDLRNEYASIRRMKYLGIPGIYLVDSGLSGPTVGVTLHTHGNEPSGMAVVWHLRHYYQIWQRLIRGKIFFVVNNLRAAERFYSARSSEKKRLCRFVDLNMNRLPADLMTTKRGSGLYEVKRARQLKNVWGLFDVAIDIHSTHQESRPMIINCGSYDPVLIHGFPIKTIILDIEKVQVRKPAAAFYGSRNVQVLGIEAGSHENPRSFVTAITCVKALLQNLGMIPGTNIANKLSKTARDTFRVIGSVFFSDNSYELTREFKSFSWVEANSIVATGKEKPITCPKSCYVILAPKGRKPMSIKEEVLFFADRVKG